MITTPKHTLRLVRKPPTNEWLVVWRTNGKRDEEKIYYTVDKQDAVDTMAFMQKTADAMNLESTP